MAHMLRVCIRTTVRIPAWNIHIAQPIDHRPVVLLMATVTIQVNQQKATTKQQKRLPIILLPKTVIGLPFSLHRFRRLFMEYHGNAAAMNQSTKTFPAGIGTAPKEKMDSNKSKTPPNMGVANLPKRVAAFGSCSLFRTFQSAGIMKHSMNVNGRPQQIDAACSALRTFF